VREGQRSMAPSKPMALLASRPPLLGAENESALVAAMPSLSIHSRHSTLWTGSCCSRLVPTGMVGEVGVGPSQTEALW